MAKKVAILWQKILFLMVLATLAGSVVVIGISMWLAPTVSVERRVKSDYVLDFLQCVLGTAALLFPGWVSHKYGWKIPSHTLAFYALFLYCAIFLGEVRGFYFLIPWWDTALHLFSGAVLSVLGFSVLKLLNKSDDLTKAFRPRLVALFVFCFAVAVGGIWEIYEFLVDAVFLTNMQKHSLENGTLLLGKKALSDTMEDLIVDVAGALAVSVIGYISLKLKKGWVEKWLVTTQR